MACQRRSVSVWALMFLLVIISAVALACDAGSHIQEAVISILQ